eukprot:6213652-Pleurochrysis_carterae.AAC.2
MRKIERGEGNSFTKGCVGLVLVWALGRRVGGGDASRCARICFRRLVDARSERRALAHPLRAAAPSRRRVRLRAAHLSAAGRQVARAAATRTVHPILDRGGACALVLCPVHALASFTYRGVERILLL